MLETVQEAVYVRAATVILLRTLLFLHSVAWMHRGARNIEFALFAQSSATIT